MDSFITDSFVDALIQIKSIRLIGICFQSRAESSKNQFLDKDSVEQVLVQTLIAIE